MLSCECVMSSLLLQFLQTHEICSSHVLQLDKGIRLRPHDLHAPLLNKLLITLLYTDSGSCNINFTLFYE